MPAILGRKLGMTQVFDGNRRFGVTVVQAGPCTVTQVKTPENDGYSAVQLGFDDKPERLCLKPEIGHDKKANTAVKRVHREMRYPEGQTPDLKLGEEVKVGSFEGTIVVDVIGTSKGKGFQGVVKRWGFLGMPASHGCSKRHRAPGALGRMGSISKGVAKGKHMAGRMGNDQVTVRCDLFKIDAEKNLLLLRGPVPGPDGGVLFIRRSKVNDVTAARRKKAADAATKAAESAKKKASVPVKK
ncbi:MAG TPA: 50S ribosomal protein L3 [Planctomycetota bacterium]|nr:50S ribosomal protein L3 [Planctomycetota bacterium]